MTDPFPREGLPLDQARLRVLADLVPHRKSESLPLSDCLGRVTSQPVCAAEAVPGFRASRMDGYALAAGPTPCAGEGMATVRRLVGRAEPGVPFKKQLNQGEAVRILTGAPVPNGAVQVVPQEAVHLGGDRQVVELQPANDQPVPSWIRPADEEARPGEVLVEAGERLGAAHLARLAACGIDQLEVSRRPSVALLITGDELVPAGKARDPGCIWESNGTLLQALLERLGYPTVMRSVVADREDSLRRVMCQMAPVADVVVSTGGVSAGDSDWIRPLVAELGGLEFWKLDLKPGRPFAYGHLQDKPFFGLPGNPVAAAITTLQLLWPALQKIEGSEVELCRRWRLPLASVIQRRSGRPELMRATLETNADGQPLARVLGSQASSRLGSLQGATLLLEIPADVEYLRAGERVWAQLLMQPLL